MDYSKEDCSVVRNAGDLIDFERYLLAGGIPDDAWKGQSFMAAYNAPGTAIRVSGKDPHRPKPQTLNHGRLLAFQDQWGASFQGSSSGTRVLQ